MIDGSILQQHVKPVTDVVRFLDSSHLPAYLQAIAQPFEDLAADILRKVPSSAFLTTTMRKIVDAKNEAVIAYIHAHEQGLRHVLPGQGAAPSDTPRANST